MLRSARLVALAVLGVGAVGLGGVACDSTSGATRARADARDGIVEKDVVDTAIAAGEFKTLATALTAAGLVDTLKGDGPFTVFAPTDDAFARLPEGALASLLKPENKEQLRGVLTYHVVPGRATAADLKDGQAVKTVNGKSVSVQIQGGKVMVGDATVTQSDIPASNGVIHVIDTVLMP